MPDRPPTDRSTSTFSKRFAAALRGYMRERDIQQIHLAHRINRSEGFISSHLSGAKPVDTDMLYAVAELAGMDARRLTDEVTRRMADMPPEPPSAAAERIVRKARADVAPPDPDPEPSNSDKDLTKKSRRRQRGA